LERIFKYFPNSFSNSQPAVSQGLLLPTISPVRRFIGLFPGSPVTTRTAKRKEKEKL
jgi:hypothetical protein